MNESSAVLGQTPNGTALWCACCGRIEMALGNAVLSLDPSELHSVLEIIDTFDVERETEGDPLHRCFIIRTERDEAAFAFNRAEVLELRALLTGVRDRLRSGRSTLAYAALPQFTTTHVLH